jgi:adenylate cyclase
VTPPTTADEAERLTLWQRSAVRKLRRTARRAKGEPLQEADWAAMWATVHSRSGRLTRRLWHALPSNPRCGICAAPFAGFGRRVVGPLGYKPSRKNPTICSTCVELSPPGGATMPVGVLFADIRGFTATSEQQSPEQTASLLRRFYGCAEDALFPEAIIDKLIGDEVMALYLSPLLGGRDAATIMVEQAAALLRGVGYGTPEGPFVDIGIGLDYGEAYVGNIGDRAVYDFTAVGDVVNTASRLTGQAAAGDIVASARVLSDEAAEARGAVRTEVILKGKARREVAYRIASPSGSAAAAAR